MQNELIYKRAVVTGASSGIGREIAKALCRARVHVVGVGRNHVELEQTEKELSGEYGQFFHASVVDISKKSDRDSLFESVGSIDLLVNVAGVGYSKPFEDHTEEEIKTVIETNLLAPIALTRGFLKNRKSKELLQTVFVTSLAGKIGFPNMSIYSATKFGLEGLCESLRMEYAGQPVSFSILRPGVTDTHFFQRAGMESFYQSVKGTRQLYSAEKVVEEFMKGLKRAKPVVTVGRDKWFLKLLPIIPFKKRFTVLDIISKL